MKTLLTLMVVVFLAVGCGGNSNPHPGTPPATPPTPPPQTNQQQQGGSWQQSLPYLIQYCEQATMGSGTYQCTGGQAQDFCYCFYGIVTQQMAFNDFAQNGRTSPISQQAAAYCQQQAGLY